MHLKDNQAAEMSAFEIADTRKADARKTDNSFNRPLIPEEAHATLL